MLWSRLRRRTPGGVVFRRQHALGAYILDFYCPAVRLAVEIDGAVHGEDSQIAHDERRDAWLRSQGVTVYRIAASSVFEDLDQVADGVRLVAAGLTIGGGEAAPSTTPSSGRGPPPPSSSRRGRQG